MRRLLPAPNLVAFLEPLLATAAVILATVASSGAQVIVGPNVNMGGGPASFTPPSTLIGDPFLQRQNEPSIAISSRNPCHLLAGANDYRAVDLEELAGEVGDAWLGVFKSFDCGATWTSTLLPGHKLDTTAAGLASPIKGLAAAADPTVRAGTSGLFYYSGIAFNRGEGQPSRVFVARFIDNNNKDGGDPIQYLGARQIDLGTSGQFLDKPWIVADVPRDGSTCTINGKTVPAGPAYLVYTSFVGGDNNVHSKILFSKSTDCGATWSNPTKLSESVARNQGTTIAIDPGTGAIHIAWREFSVAGDSNTRNAIMVVRSTNGGNSFTKAAAIEPQFTPFDQASSVLTFRTNAYPTIAVVPAEVEGRAAGQPGRVYAAWSALGFGGARPNDARVVISTSIGGATWSAPRTADSFTGSGHQIMPTMAFAGGKLALAYYDLRNDASGGFEDLVVEYGQAAYEQCLATTAGLPFAQTFLCMLSHPDGLQRRHTLDMRAAMAGADCLATNSCGFSSASVLGGSNQVSRYAEGRGVVNGDRVQLQYNRPNLPIFSRGRFPFIGDYIDIAGQSFVALENGGWAWNTGLTANRPSPVFHVSWADNRNVGTPRNANWEPFTPAVLGPNAVACVPGQVGIRNQDVYTAQLRPGLVVSSPHNSKRIAGLQRSFVVIANNTTDVEHDYRMRANPTVGVIASFDQFAGFGALDGGGVPVAPLTEVIVRIPRKSSVSRTLFVGLVDAPADPNAAPDVLVPVTVDEIAGGTPTGTFDMVYLNPDFENPDFENPDFENTELHNPDFENPDFENPDFENPDFENFTLSASSSIRNPDFENPDFENPDFENPDFENPDFENPDFENPDFENPDFENPDFENPDFENPDFENPDFENGSFQVADTTWPVRNNGNTTSAYKTNVFVNDPPAGVRYQLAIRKIFTSPAAVCAVPGSTEAPRTAQSVPIVNIIDANVATNPFDRNFNDPSRENATFSLAPGERGIITLRAYCDEGATSCTRDLLASLQNRVALGVVAQGANCARCTGASCTNNDFVGSFTECSLETGLPRDIYDPIPPTAVVVDPTLTSPETTIVAIDGDNNGYEGVSFAVSATDNVAVAAVTCQSPTTAITFSGVTGDRYSFGGVFPVGTTGVACTATDVRANPGPNSSVVNFLVTVRDVTPPSFDLSGGDPGSPFLPSNPAEATGPGGAVVHYTNPSASDSNGGAVTVVCGSNGGLQSGSTFPVGTTAINCVATDASGVSTPPTNLFDITVADTTPPSITVTGPSTITIEAGSAYGDAGASASDLVAGAISVSSSNNILPMVPGTYAVTYTATDPSGNTATATRVVIVRDTTPPVVTVSGPGAPIEGNTLGGTRVTFTSSASDLVSGSLATSCTPASGSLFPVGTTNVTCSATDGAGLTGSRSFAVTITDTRAPTVTLIGASSVNVEAGTAYSEAGASAFDIVSGSLSTTIVGSVNTTVLGTYTLTYRATDAAGNVGTTTRTVTVVDTTAPVITEAATPNVLLWSPNKTMTPVTVSGVITDFSPTTANYRVVDEYGKVQPSGSITIGAGGAYSFVVRLEAYRNGNDANGRVYTVTVTATDAGGRTSTKSAVVLVPHNQ
jgi:hypothetical protein